MTFEPMDIPDVVRITPQSHGDSRGSFMEVYRESAFRSAGIDVRFVQENQSASRKNVLRGLHYQAPSAAQAKLVRVVSGEVFDVAVDVRNSSPSYGRWVGCRLSAANRRMVYVPAGFAHGFVVLSDAAEVAYQISAEYAPEHERGICWNDPDLAIDWPVQQPVLSARDSAHPRLRDAVPWDDPADSCQGRPGHDAAPPGLRNVDPVAFNTAYTGVREDLADLVPPSATLLLDLGCSTGRLGETLKRRSHGLRVYGVEADRNMAREAQRVLDRVLVADLNDASWPRLLEGMRFDCIVMGDILEHLRDPWATLKLAGDCLGAGGSLIASVPNIRHVSSLYALIVEGYWPYRSRGIHDRTHLRFFTLKNIRSMFGDSRLTIREVRRNYRMFDSSRRAANLACRCLALPGLREFLAYQYLIVAEKTERAPAAGAGAVGRRGHDPAAAAGAESRGG